MEEAFVQLSCPECNKAWEASPSELPGPQKTYRCPDCRESRRTSEFMRTDRDLETLKQFA